jgi:hypothetical protein
VSDTRVGYPPLELSEDQRGLLRHYAGLFDELARQVPAAARYTASEFLEWVDLEERMRSPDEVSQRMRRGHQLRRESHQLRMATG